MLILLTRHVGHVGTPALASAADPRAKTRRELKVVTLPPGRTSVVHGACWLADSGLLALSVAHPRPGNLTAAHQFLPRSVEYALLMLRTVDSQVISRVSGAAGPACGPRRL